MSFYVSTSPYFSTYTGGLRLFSPFYQYESLPALYVGGMDSPNGGVLPVASGGWFIECGVPLTASGLCSDVVSYGIADFVSSPPVWSGSSYGSGSEFGSGGTDGGTGSNDLIESLNTVMVDFQPDLFSTIIFGTLLALSIGWAGGLFINVIYKGKKF